MSYPEALRKMADEVEAKEKAQAALLHEQSAHCVTKESLAEALKRLGYDGQFSGVRAQSWLYDFFDGSKHGLFTGVGRFLSSALKQQGKFNVLARVLEINDRNGIINKITVYHTVVWMIFRTWLALGFVNSSTPYCGKFIKPQNEWPYMPHETTKEELQAQIALLKKSLTASTGV